MPRKPPREDEKYIVWEFQFDWKERTEVHWLKGGWVCRAMGYGPRGGNRQMVMIPLYIICELADEYYARAAAQEAEEKNG